MQVNNILDAKRFEYELFYQIIAQVFINEGCFKLRNPPIIVIYLP